MAEIANQTGSWASKKSYQLPADLLQELRRTDETVQQLIERLIPGDNDAGVPTASSSSSTEKSDAQHGDAFMDALLSLPDTRTTNDAPAFSTSKDALVDLFYDLAPHSGNNLERLLNDSWKADSLSTLKCIFQARSIHEGKGMKDHVFFSCMSWLLTNHPRTLLTNLHLLVERVCERPDIKVKGEDGIDEIVERSSVPHGYWKDLLNLLVLGAHGFLEGPVGIHQVNLAFHSGYSSAAFSATFSQNKKKRLDKALLRAFARDKSKTTAKLLARYKNYHRQSKAQRHQSGKNYLLQELQHNKKYRAMYIVVAQLFASALQADLPFVDVLAHAPVEQKFSVASQLSLCAKWSPTPGKSHDKQTLISSAVAAILFPSEPDLVKSRVAFQTSYLAPLRKALDVVEVKMAAGLWSEINYQRVPSQAMAIHKASFFKHDETRFMRYLEDVIGGKRKISAATLLPHELLIDSMAFTSMYGASKAVLQLPPEARDRFIAASSRIIDAQWNSLVNTLRETSTAALDSCIAIVDVSGSMGRLSAKTSKSKPTPVAVAVALGILLSQLARPPFDGAFITFSAQPQICRLQGKTLSEIATNVLASPWEGLNTNFGAVFDLILSLAVERKLRPEEMVKKLFVFSDMQFDSASGHTYGHVSTPWKTIHQLAVEKYAKAGYELPEIVYWNIQGAVEYQDPYGDDDDDSAAMASLPVQADQEGVDLMSGYSASLMKVFLGQAEQAEFEALQAKKDAEEMDDADSGLQKKVKQKRETPAEKVRKVLANKAFEGLRVVD